MRKLFLASVMVGVFTAVAAAQVPTSGNVFFGYSYYNTNPSGIDRVSTNGWEASVEGKVLPFIGIVGDFSAYYGSEDFPAVCSGVGLCIPSYSANIAEHNYLFGPRASVSVGKFRPFAEGMIGVAHINANAAGSDNSFASAVGGGIDYRLLRILAWRFEGDYVHAHLFNISENNVRLSTGIVVRF
ncbi:MAG TPA: hypothetical protein VMX38_09360 [Verrucomicrobiae bacterium]|jgi:hypothetical protein|nr:hypothetical protein [Verrucomicrobiae bacterium]